MSNPIEISDGMTRFKVGEHEFALDLVGALKRIRAAAEATPDNFAYLAEVKRVVGEASDGLLFNDSQADEFADLLVRLYDEVKKKRQSGGATTPGLPSSSLATPSG